MKKLLMTLIITLLLSNPLFASKWQHQVIMNDYDATSADLTTYIMSGTNACYITMYLWTDSMTYSGSPAVLQWHSMQNAKEMDMYACIEGAPTPSTAKAFTSADNEDFIVLGSYADDTVLSTIGIICFGDSIRIQYLKNDATAGNINLDIFVKPIE